MIKSPVAFVSYSHDDESHKNWVRDLAKFLMENGVDTIIDQWSLGIGQDLPEFMENGLGTSQKIIIVCTDQYNAKANGGKGGVGYEKRILTADILHGQDQRKFIPIVRNVAADRKIPVFLGGAMYIDLSTKEDEAAKRNILLRNIYEISEKPPLGTSPFASKVPIETSPLTKIVEQPALNGVTSTTFFARRFAEAFPGSRGISWFKEENEISLRLGEFFKDPIVFKDASPIWWWREGNLQIETFRNLGRGLFLMGPEELQISKIAAVNVGDYFRNFIYVETQPMPPTGLYKQSAQLQNRAGCLIEEYGLYQGTKLLTRAQYDDGGAVIDGRIVNTLGDSELRVRHITPYNFVVAPHGSPINNPEFDATLENILDGMLAGESSIDDLISATKQLPKRAF